MPKPLVGLDRSMTRIERAAHKHNARKYARHVSKVEVNSQIDEFVYGLVDDIFMAHDEANTEDLEREYRSVYFK